MLIKASGSGCLFHTIFAGHGVKHAAAADGTRVNKP